MAETTKHRNKIIYHGETLIDLTNDTVTGDKLAIGVTAHDKSGKIITGTNTYDADTSDGDAASAEILKDKIAYINGERVVGSMPNKGAIEGKISTKDQEYAIPVGFHDGSGKVAIADAEKAKIIATNIRSGISILGVEGTMSGTEDVTAGQVTVTSSATDDTTVNPPEGCNYISQVVVKKIPYTETDNPQGGITVTIG